MKKRALAILMAALTASTMFAVPTFAADYSGEDPQLEKNIKILTIWAEDNDNGMLLNKICEDYQKNVNPNFTWEYEMVASDNLQQKIATLAASNDLPDLFAYEAGAPLSVLIDSGKVKNITEAVDEIGTADYLNSGAVELLKGLSGTDDLYDLPLGLNVEGFWYNKALFEQAGCEVPTTWDELKAACEALKAYDDSIYPWGIDMTTDEGQAAFAYYTWNNGGGFVDDEGNSTLNSEQNVEAIQYAIDLVNSGYTNTDPANDTRYDLQDMFGAGKVAMLIAPNSLPTYIATGGNEVNYGVASIPSNTGESVSAGVMDRFMCFDNDYSDDEKAAISTFFDYFYDDARYTEWVDMEGFLPATKTGGEALAAANEDMASWIDILDSCKFYPTAKAEWADVKQGVINVEQNALLGSDVQELLDDLQAEIAG